MAGDTRTQLARKMNDRRLQLRRSWAEIARLAGMDESNLRRIRNGKIEISDLAERGLEDALELEGGSIRTVLDDPDAELHPRGSAGLHRAKRKRPPLDPLKSTPEEIAEFLEEVRQVQGDEVFFELFQATLKVNMQAREERERTERRPPDRTDAGTTASDNN